MKTNVQSQRFYDLVAPQYDHITRRDSYAHDLAPFLASHASAIRRVLDVGAGTGKTIESLFGVVRPERVVAVDVSAPMLHELAKKYPQVEIVHGDILAYIATEPKPFDLITAFSVLELLCDFEPVIDALAHKLNPGGLFIFTYEPILPQRPTQASAETTYWSLPDAPYTMFRRHPESVIAMLEHNGLRTLRHEPIPRAYRRDDGSVELRFVAAQAPSRP